MTKTGAAAGSATYPPRKRSYTIQYVVRAVDILNSFTSTSEILCAALVRSTKPDAGRVQFPTYALDATWPQFMNEMVFRYG